AISRAIKVDRNSVTPATTRGWSGPGYWVRSLTHTFLPSEGIRRLLPIAAVYCGGSKHICPKAAWGRWRRSSRPSRPIEPWAHRRRPGASPKCCESSESSCRTQSRFRTRRAPCKVRPLGSGGRALRGAGGSMRLDRADIRFLVICLIVAAVCGFVGVRYYDQVFPEAAITFSVDRN